MNIPELFMEIVQCMARHHGQPLPKGLVTVTTSAEGPGPIKATMNATADATAEIPAFSILLEHGESGWPIGIIGPSGGELMVSRQPGEDEGGLIEHFKAH